MGREWIARDVPVTLKIVASPYREITRLIIDYVKSLRTDNPRDVVIVYVPEYVVGHCGSNLHNQSALRLRGASALHPWVMVASVPWQLRSSGGAVGRLGRPLGPWPRRQHRPVVPVSRSSG